MLSIGLLLLSLFQTTTTPEQEQVFDTLESNILRRFDDLPTDEQQRIATELEEYVLSLEHPLCISARSILDDRRLKNSSKHRQEALPVYSANNFAPALRLKTVVLEPGDKAWDTFQKRFMPRGIVDRYSTWWWDYATNTFLLPTEEKPRDVLVAMLAGRWPDSGKLAAFAEGFLDSNRDFDDIADYFEHTYRDRDGKVYSEIRLYDMWSSAQAFGISDVESIAYLRRIADKDDIVSPIAGSLHDAIYSQILNSFVDYRNYRDLRHALAQRMVNPLGALPRLYVGAENILDDAWILMDHSPSRMASFLARHDRRKDFFSAVAKRSPKTESGKSSGSWAKHAEMRATMPEFIRAFTLEFLRDEGLLGFHRR